DHDDRAIEERDGGVRAGRRTETVALTDDRAVRYGGVCATRVTHLHVAVEDGEPAACVDRGDRGARPEHEPETGDEEEQRREQRGDRHPTSRERGQEDQRPALVLQLLWRR